MTIADQPTPRTSRGTLAASRFPAAAAGRPGIPARSPFIPPPQFPLPEPSGQSWLSLFATDRMPQWAESDPKPEADVVDLFIMNTLDHPAGAAPAVPHAADGADLLDSLVADHLERATQPAEAAREEEEMAAPPEENPPDPASGIDLLQREIEALLAGTPSASAPKEQAHREEALEETRIEEPADESMDEAIPPSPPLNQAELDVLLAGTPPPPHTTAHESAKGASSPAAAALPADEDEAASKMLEAEGVLAEELAQLMAETAPPPTVVAAPVTVEEPVPETATAASGASATASVDGSVETVVEEVPQRPPGVPEHPVVELAGEVEGDFDTEIEPAKPQHRWTGIFSDIALVAAQIADMPFRWIDVMDKNLLGVAAAVLLLSGLVLKLVAMWMGV